MTGCPLTKILFPDDECLDIECDLENEHDGPCYNEDWDISWNEDLV